MLYHFTYQLKENTNTKIKVCHTLREAEVFFDILVSVPAFYICVKTFYIRGANYDKK